MTNEPKVTGATDTSILPGAEWNDFADKIMALFEDSQNYAELTMAQARVKELRAQLQAAEMRVGEALSKII